MAGDDPSADVSVTVDSAHPGTSQTVCSGPDIGLCAAGPFFSGSVQVLAKAGADVMVAMSINLGDTHGGHAERFIDPIISINPDFLSTHPGYSLQFSEGIGNSPLSAVPLPGSIWLLRALVKIN